MGWHDKFLDKLSEKHFYSLLLILLGVFLIAITITATLEKVGLTTSSDINLKIIAETSGVVLVIAGVFLANKKEQTIKNDNNKKVELLLSEIKNIKEQIDAVSVKVDDYLKLPEESKNIQVINNGRAFLFMEKYLYCPSKIAKNEISDAFSNASPAARYAIFGTIKFVREDMVYNLLSCRMHSEQTKIKREIAHLIIPFEIIAKIEGKNDSSKYLHEIFANLAYSYKDSIKPTWEDALHFINIAIEKRDLGQYDKRFYVDYEINRMLCNINLEKCERERYEEIEEDFKWIWSFGNGQNRIMDVPPVLFPNFYEWMSAYKLENMVDWLNRHTEKQRDWFDKMLSDKVKEKVNRKM